MIDTYKLYFFNVSLSIQTVELKLTTLGVSSPSPGDL